MLSADSLLALVFVFLSATLIYLAFARRDTRSRAVAGIAGALFLAGALDQMADVWTALKPGFGAAAVAVAAAALAVALAVVLAPRLGDIRWATSGEASGAGTEDELAREIASRKLLEQQLAAARDEAMAANRAKSQFLAYMSHELRTPLNAILGFSQIISDELLGPPGRRRYIDYVRDIQHSGEHLLDIVNELLEISRIEAGKAKVTESVVDPPDMIAVAERMMAARARDAGIAFSASVDRGTPSLIADARMVKQMLLNLLSNAIKFTPVGGSVRLVAGLAADGGVIFVVSDSGIGIPANDISRALEPFGRLQSDHSRVDGAGFGLGLPICKALAGLHGATLELDSAPGLGTIARIKFPAIRTKLQALAG